MHTKKEEITLIGAGLSGALLSILLAKKGLKVNVYEKRSDPRCSKAESGRSINLALSHRGWKALKKAGVAEQIAPEALPMKGRMMHDIRGALTFQAYSASGKTIYSILRNSLNRQLIAAADAYENISFHFDTFCESVSLGERKVLFSHKPPKQKETRFAVKSGLIIGSDGAFSQLRAAMQKTPRFDYCQEYLSHGYKEFCIPASADNDFRINPAALHIWARKQFMLIALPNPDKSFTATLFLPFEGAHSFDTLQNEQQITQFFADFFPDTHTLIPNLTDEFLHNPTASLLTIRCKPWIYQSSAMLIGDAAHTVVPFYGQGMNASFEDCSVFDNLLDEYGTDWQKILPIYQAHRLENGHAIAELALQNFVEMRDLVRSPDFLLRKKIEARLHQLMPQKWIPLYTMVTFSDMPYAQALRIGKQQEKVMDQIMQEQNIAQGWENICWEKHPIIKKYLDDFVPALMPSEFDF